jgi:hypothetical protein
MMDAGNGGCGLGAVTSDASTLPTASGNGRDSSSSGAARLSTMSIASGIEIMGYLCGAIVAGDRRARDTGVSEREIPRPCTKVVHAFVFFSLLECVSTSRTSEKN